SADAWTSAEPTCEDARPAARADATAPDAAPEAPSEAPCGSPRFDHPTATAINALFASDLQPSAHPSPADVEAGIGAAIARLGVIGCAGLVASEFGDQPDLACRRMRWVLTVLGHGDADEGRLPLPRRI